MWSERFLDDLLTEPTPELVEDIKNLQGDILVLGAGGKMGPTLCVLASRAVKAAGVHKKIIAVSRFSDETVKALLDSHGIERVEADLLDPAQVADLPDAENVIFMAGKKFGTTGQEYLTWAMNVMVPGLVANRYQKSRILVFSSGNIYPMMPFYSGGADESVDPAPIGNMRRVVWGVNAFLSISHMHTARNVCFIA